MICKQNLEINISIKKANSYMCACCYKRCDFQGCGGCVLHLYFTSSWNLCILYYFSVNCRQWRLLKSGAHNIGICRDSITCTAHTLSTKHVFKGHTQHISWLCENVNVDLRIGGRKQYYFEWKIQTLDNGNLSWVLVTHSYLFVGARIPC